MPSPRAVPSLSGQGLAALRREAGLTQTQFAHLAGIGRHAVSRWEQVPVVDPWGWAPKRILKVLGIRIVPPVVPHIETNTRGRATRARHGLLLPSLDEPILAVSRQVE